jgi:hypothetical protein
VIHLSGRKLKTRSDVFRLKEWIVLQYLRLRHPSPEEIKHILDPQAIASDAGPPPALLRVNGDSIEVAHTFILSAKAFRREFVFSQFSPSTAQRFQYARRLNSRQL